MFKLKKDNLRTIVLAICGKKGLNLTTDQRREIQLDVIGEASLSDMSVPQLEDLIAHLRRLQRAGDQVAQATPAGDDDWRFVFRMASERQRYGKKIFRLAQRAGKLLTPPVPVAPKHWVEGITAQMRGTTQPLEFCDCPQLLKVIQALDIYLQRHGA